MKMKFLTTKDLNNLPPLYSTENDRDPVAWVKLFNPRGRGTWFLTEYDGKRTAFGYTMGLGGDELGYIDIPELQKNGIERDMHYKPVQLSKAKAMQKKLHGESHSMSSLLGRIEESKGELSEGYTHYFSHGGWTDKGWLKFLKDVGAIVKRAKKEISVDFESNGEYIMFNGHGPDGHEDLYITLEPQDGFNFVKTGGMSGIKPYDKWVVEIMKAAKKNNRGMKLSSDGGPEIFG